MADTRLIVTTVQDELRVREHGAQSRAAEKLGLTRQRVNEVWLAWQRECQAREAQSEQRSAVLAETTVDDDLTYEPAPGQVAYENDRLLRQLMGEFAVPDMTTPRRQITSSARSGCAACQAWFVWKRQAIELHLTLLNGLTDSERTAWRFWIVASWWFVAMPLVCLLHDQWGWGALCTITSIGWFLLTRPARWSFPYPCLPPPITSTSTSPARDES